MVSYMLNTLKRLYLWFSGTVQIPRNLLFCWSHGLRGDMTWRFYGLPCVRRGGRGSVIQIGRNFVANSSWRHNSFGIIQPVMIRTVGHGAKIEIGDDVGVSGCTISAKTLIRIGNRVLIGSGAVISDCDAHPVDPEERRQGLGGTSKPVVIEDDVFVGARALILKGVTIGRGSVIGAGTIVTHDIPLYSVAVGNPARVIGDSRRKG